MKRISLTKLAQGPRLVSALLFLLGVGLIFHSTSGSQEERFALAWAKDLKFLEGKKILPPQFHDLKDIEAKGMSRKLEDIYKRFPIGLKTTPEGKYRLEIFMDEIEGEEGVVIQYDLIDDASGNTIWELGRTFPNQLHLAPRALASPTSSLKPPPRRSPSPG